ncbi:hypothetical protein [Fibrella forsythiae]|uniref:Uncharacterized protein n=1 Tax=Fibrella forsythiae TaxID=2817061 RepID=A0ABS3JPE0_9BACT|nr:hypothetical protein [Fibrella forsythiae]MBO0951870.1 hypothetical protein [Fibrella forsythiae]
MSTLQIRPRNADEQQFVEQFLKRTKIKFEVISQETPKQMQKREILDSIEKGLKDVQLHQEGKIKLISTRELLNEL